MNWLAFHKALPTLILPFRASLFILAAALRFLRRALVAIPLATLWILGTPAISDTLMRSLEDRYPPCAVKQCPQADAVFAFGGILKPREQLTGEIDGADRFNRALALYVAGRAHTLVFSGGQAHHPGSPSEGDRLSEIARLRGVPDQAIIVIHQTTNTASEAEALSKLAAVKHWKRILLVTSAFHMPRAMRLIKNYPIEGIPVPVGYFTSDPKTSADILGLQDFLPRAEALAISELALREYLGISFYALPRNLLSDRRW